jgi:hypothetical protein
MFPNANIKATEGDDMYFWRIKKLKKRLIEQPLSDREALPYLVVANGLSAALAFFQYCLSAILKLGLSLQHGTTCFLLEP